jgi:chemotaxis protein methyltransferase CheR
VLPQVDVTTREATPASPAQPAQVATPLKSQAPRRTVKSGISGASPSQTEPAPLERCLSDLQALASLRDPQRTAAAVTAALEIHPLAPEIHYFQAIVLMSAGHYDEAAAALRRAIYLDRSMAVAHFALGSILQRRGLIAQAQRSYRNVLAVCDQRRADEIVPCSDGEPTGRLIEAARTQLARIAHSTGSPP